MRICLIAPLPPPYGGISHWTQMIMRYGKTSGVDIVLLNIAPRWRDLHDTAKLKRVVGGGLQLIKNMASFLGLLLFQKPDVVHLTTPGGMAVVRDVVFICISRFFLKPIVYHIRFGRAASLMSDRWAVESILFYMACKLSSKVIAIDEETYGVLKDFGNAVLIPNCYDENELPSSSDFNKNVVFIGWIIPTKGVEELISAWRRLAVDDWRLVFIGPGDPKYIDQLAGLSAGFDIRFMGGMKHYDAMSVLAESSILVLPSYTEGFPNVVLEGMALGRAVIATSVGAIPEMLSGGAGVLVPPKNISELSRALNLLIHNPERCVKMGKIALEKAEMNYSLSSVFASYRILWETVS